MVNKDKNKKLDEDIKKLLRYPFNPEYIQYLKLLNEEFEKREKAVKKGKDRSNRIPVFRKQDTLDYDAKLEILQVELGKIQKHIIAKKLKVLMIFEGRDAAGKGGTIQRFTQYQSQRDFRVVALNKPTEAEKTQMYMQRYIKQFPKGGEIVFMDRSWYNRLGVETVMEFCDERETAKFLTEVSIQEKLMVDNGIIFFKFYFSISKEEQIKRLKERETDPLKWYKLSDIDKSSADLYDDYTHAEAEMLQASHKEHAQWTVFDNNDKKVGRLNALGYYILSFMDKYPYPDMIDRDIVKNIMDESKIQHGSDRNIEIRKTHKFVRKED